MASTETPITQPTMDVAADGHEGSDFATISHAKLVKRDAKELNAMRKACEQDGFWYLDLRAENGAPPLLEQEASTVYQLAEDFFNLADDEKIKFDVDKIGPWKLNGYVSRCYCSILMFPILNKKQLHALWPQCWSRWG